MRCWISSRATFSTRRTLSFGATAFAGSIRKWRAWWWRRFRHRNFRPRPAGIDVKLLLRIAASDASIGRISFSNGSRGGALPVFDALGCLRSLRARLALDGVSWAQGGEVENAVGRWVGRVRQNRRRRLLPPWGVAPCGSSMRSPILVTGRSTQRRTPSRLVAWRA